MQGSEEDSSAVAILHRVATFLRSLTPEEAEDLANGRVKLTLVGRERKRPAARELPSERITDIVRRLRGMDTREEGASYLADEVPTRAKLVQVALAMDAPVRKTDNVSKLRERVVEAAIGYRLRSDAIRGTDREGGKESG